MLLQNLIASIDTHIHRMAFIDSDFEAWLLIFTIENSNVKQFHTQDLSGFVLLFFLNLTDTKAVFSKNHPK